MYCLNYIKYILQNEEIDVGKTQTFVDIYEFLSNQQDIQKIGKKILGTLKLKGAVSLVRYYDSRFYLVESMGSTETVQKALDDKSVLKEIRNTKTLYQSTEEELTKPYYMALPILSKNDEFLGALCIHEKQDVKCWKDIYVLLHLMAFAFKYYEMIELNKSFTIKDSVTNLYNYRHFQNHLDIEIDKSNRYHMPLSMVLIDIENFKMINEKLGYDAGDEVLRQVAKWIQVTSRKVDMPARIEGDKFAIILSNTPLEGAKIFLERLLIKINNNTISIKGKELKLRVKTSAVGFETNFSRQEFLDEAEKQLEVRE